MPLARMHLVGPDIHWNEAMAGHGYELYGDRQAQQSYQAVVHYGTEPFWEAMAEDRHRDPKLTLILEMLIALGYYSVTRDRKSVV